MKRWWLREREEEERDTAEMAEAGMRIWGEEQMKTSLFKQVEPCRSGLIGLNLWLAGRAIHCP